MNKKISLGAAIAFMFIVATATFAMTVIYATNNFNSKVVALREREAQYEKFAEIDMKVRQQYFGTINETQLMDSVASGYINGLGDDYAMYIDARTYERMLRDQEGQLMGIGADLAANVDGDGYLSVQRVYAASPAEAEGIEVGDLIVRIDDTDLTPENSAQMLESLQGESGTKVTLVVRKGSEDIAVEITRRPVTIPVVHSQIIENTNVGYLYIEEFNDNTSDQFNRELQRLIDSGVTSVIFDVRDNKGGNLRQSIRMLDKLLPAGLIASYTTNDGTVETFTSDANEIDLPMVVLVNNNTASAAELFAQALKDYNKARVVGTATSGKGVIQQTFQLDDGSAISITIAELLGPTNETFNKEGVKPDFEVSLSTDQDWTELNFQSDSQLVKALEVAQGLERTGDSASAQPLDEPEELSLSEEDVGSESSAVHDESSLGEEASSSEADEENSQADEESEPDDN